MISSRKLDEQIQKQPHKFMGKNRLVNLHCNLAKEETLKAMKKEFKSHRANSLLISLFWSVRKRICLHSAFSHRSGFFVARSLRQTQANTLPCIPDSRLINNAYLTFNWKT